MLSRLPSPPPSSTSLSVLSPSKVPSERPRPSFGEFQTIFENTFWCQIRIFWDTCKNRFLNFSQFCQMVRYENNRVGRGQKWTFHIKYVFILPTVQVQAGRGARQEGWFPWKAPHSCDFGATGDYYDGASGENDGGGGVDISHDNDDSEDGGDIGGFGFWSKFSALGLCLRWWWCEFHN